MSQNNAKGNNAAGGLAAPVTATTRAVSGTYTVDGSGSDYILLVDTSAARAITLPAATSGRVIVIKDTIGTAETYNITLTRAGSESIEGVAANRILSTNWGKWTFVCNGTNWFLI